MEALNLCFVLRQKLYKTSDQPINSRHIELEDIYSVDILVKSSGLKRDCARTDISQV